VNSPFTARLDGALRIETLFCGLLHNVTTDDAR